MPFCEDCARYWTPTAMSVDGQCPQCGRVLESTTRAPSASSTKKLDLKSLASSGGEEDVSAPWHFKLLVLGLILYLGWRVVDLFI